MSSSSLAFLYWMKASPRCFQSEQFFTALLHSSSTNLTISSLQQHCSFFLGLFLLLGIQYRSLAVQLSLFLLASSPPNYILNFFTQQMIPEFLVCSLIHLYCFWLFVWILTIHLFMLLLVVWNFLKILLVNVHISKAWTITGKIHWLKTFLFKQIWRPLLKIVLCLLNSLQAIISLLLTFSIMLPFIAMTWPR